MEKAVVNDPPEGDFIPIKRQRSAKLFLEVDLDNRWEVSTSSPIEFLEVNSWGGSESFPCVIR